MFVSKAVLVTNHPEIGIRPQLYTVAPNLRSVAIQFSQLQGREISPTRLRWMIHGNLLFVAAPARPADKPMFFNPCPHHKLGFDSQVLVFLCTMSKQDAAARLSLDGSWAHIVSDFDETDLTVLQPMFSHGRGNIVLDRATKPLRSIDGRSDEPSKPSGAGGPKAPEENFDPMSNMFEHMVGAGFDVKLLRDDEGHILGLAASIEHEPLNERDLAEDPGFYADRAPEAHCVSIGLMAEVNFDPVHFPGPTGFISALIAAYARLLALNLKDDHIEPEQAHILLDMCLPYVELINAQQKAEPTMLELESPVLAKMPDEKGGMGRDS